MMKAKGEFIFRGIEKREGGNFINDKGETISYKPSYKIKVDEQTEKGVFERVLKVSEDNTQLINNFQLLDTYQRIIITFDIVFYATSISLIPTDVEIA